MTTSLVDIFCPIEERIINITGKRSTGVSERDEAALNMFGSRVGSSDRVVIYGNLSWNKLKEKSNGNVFSSGGAPNIYSILAQYPTIIEIMQKNPTEVYAFTLEDMIQAIERQPENPPIRAIYHTPVLETLETVEISNLERLLGIKEIKDYKKLRFLPDIPNIGYLQAYKDLGVTEPHWIFETTAVIPSAEQKPLTLATQDVPFVEGYDPFLILAGVNFVNPGYNMMVFVGGRGQSTFAAELVGIGKEQVSKQELEKARLQNATCYMNLPDRPHHVEGINYFLKQVEEKLREGLSSKYGKKFKGNYFNVAILGMAHIKGDLPLSVIGPIDVRFYNPVK